MRYLSPDLTHFTSKCRKILSQHDFMFCFHKTSQKLYLLTKNECIFKRSNIQHFSPQTSNQKHGEG